MTKQGPRSQGIENDRDFRRWNLPRPKPSKCTLGGLFSDDLRLFHLGSVPSRRDPIIPLHAIFRLSNRHTIQCSARALIGAIETLRVCDRYLSASVVERCTLGIGNCPIGGKRRRFCPNREIDAFGGL